MPKASAKKDEYPISWQNHFYLFVRKLPVHPLVTFFVLFVFFVFINHFPPGSMAGCPGGALMFTSGVSNFGSWLFLLPGIISYP